MIVQETAMSWCGRCPGCGRRRIRGLGYGYYERQKADLAHDPAWTVLLNEYRDLEGVDLVRFTFELDEAVANIYELVSTILKSGTGRG